MCRLRFQSEWGRRWSMGFSCWARRDKAEGMRAVRPQLRLTSTSTSHRIASHRIAGWEGEDAEQDSVELLLWAKHSQPDRQDVPGCASNL
jgi:hypothetical protein